MPYSTAGRPRPSFLTRLEAARRAWSRVLGAGRAPLDIRIAGFVVLMGVVVAFRLLSVYPWNEYVFDLHAYWITREGVDYANQHAGPAGAYLYSPAFAQLISPLTSLPLPLFSGIWTALIAGLLLWLTGRNVFVIAMLPPVLLSLIQGQLDLVYAVVAVVGLRWPAVWAVPLLTKVTPGIGIVWFLVRREWRSLAIAVGATLAVVAVSFVIDPSAWLGWLSLVYRAEFPSDPALVYLAVPLQLRAPIALALIVWGARTDRRWTIPVAMTLAMPIVWFNSPTILVALLAPMSLWAGQRRSERAEAALA